MNKTTLVILLTLGLLGFFAVTRGASGQELTADLEETLQGQLDRRIEKVEAWRFSARTTLGLTLAVGILGFVVSALQAHKRPKLATTVLGVTISTLTLVNNAVYQADHKTFRRAANRAEAYIEEAELHLARVGSVDPASPADWDFVVGELKKKLKAIDAIERELDGEKSSASEVQLAEVPLGERIVGRALAATSILAGEAQAQKDGGAPPRWISIPPRSNEALYFVGSAVGDSLRDASERARDAAEDEAAGYLEARIERGLGRSAGIDAGKLARHLVESAEVVSTYYSPPSRGRYRLWALLELDRDSIATDLELYGLTERRPVPRSVVHRLRTLLLAPQEEPAAPR